MCAGLLLGWVFTPLYCQGAKRAPSFDASRQCRRQQEFTLRVMLSRGRPSRAAEACKAQPKRGQDSGQVGPSWVYCSTSLYEQKAALRISNHPRWASARVTILSDTNTRAAEHVRDRQSHGINLGTHQYPVQNLGAAGGWRHVGPQRTWTRPSAHEWTSARVTPAPWMGGPGSLGAGLSHLL